MSSHSDQKATEADVSDERNQNLPVGWQMAKDAYQLILKIRDADKKFRRSRTQVLLLNDRLRAMYVRFNRCRLHLVHSSTSNRMQIEVVEGVRDMFFQYGRCQIKNIDDLQSQLWELTGWDYEFEEEL